MYGPILLLPLFSTIEFAGLMLQIEHLIHV